MLCRRAVGEGCDRGEERLWMLLQEAPRGNGLT